MRILQFFLNLPWTALGLLGALLNGAICSWEWKNGACIITLKHLRLIELFTRMAIGGVTLGRIVLLKADLSHRDRILRHELAHVAQYDRYFGIFPALYL